MARGRAIEARAGPLQGKRGLAPFSGVGACVMFSSLVAPHGSTSHQENMNMNAFKKTLVAIAAVATFGGLASTQASAGYYSYGGYGGGYGYSQPSYGYGYGAP